MPFLRHQQSYFNHPVVENYVKAKGKFHIFSYINAVSLSMTKLLSEMLRHAQKECTVFLTLKFLKQWKNTSSLFKALTTLQCTLTLQSQAVHKMLFVSNELNLAVLRETNEISNM